MKWKLKQWQMWWSEWSLAWQRHGPDEYQRHDLIVVIGPLQLWFEGR